MYLDDEVLSSKNCCEWLTRRFISNIQGYLNIHKGATYFDNEDKASVLLASAKKKVITAQPGNENETNVQANSDFKSPSGIELVTKKNLYDKLIDEDEADRDMLMNRGKHINHGQTRSSEGPYTAMNDDVTVKYEEMYNDDTSNCEGENQHMKDSLTHDNSL